MSDIVIIKQNLEASFYQAVPSESGSNGRHNIGHNGKERVGRIIGLVGAPGIGKGYITRGLRRHTDNLHFLPRITTREPRPTDADEGVVTVSTDEFQKLHEHIIGIHRPFNDHRLYGWHAEEAQQGIKQGKNYITDPNVELLDKFHDRFGDSLHLIGLTAEKGYLEANLSERAFSDKPSGVLAQKDLDDIRKRLEVGEAYSSKVREAFSKGFLHNLVEVNFGNRSIIVEVVKNEIARNIGLFDPEISPIPGVEFNGRRNGTHNEAMFRSGGKERF